MTTAFSRAIVFTALCAHAAIAHAQDAGPAGRPQPAQTQKIPGADMPITRGYMWVESRIDGGSGTSDGLYPELGGIIPGAVSRLALAIGSISSVTAPS